MPSSMEKNTVYVYYTMQGKKRLSNPKTKNANLPLIPIDDLMYIVRQRSSDSDVSKVSSMVILPDNLLSASGQKRWNEKRMRCIEQTQVTDIYSDDLCLPKRTQFSLRDYKSRGPNSSTFNEFTELDVRVDEIEKYASKMRNDFSSLGIPADIQYNVPEPLFETHQRKITLSSETKTTETVTHSRSTAPLTRSQHHPSQMSSIKLQKAQEALDAVPNHPRGKHEKSPEKPSNERKVNVSRAMQLAFESYDGF